MTFELVNLVFCHSRFCDKAKGYLMDGPWDEIKGGICKCTINDISGNLRDKGCTGIVLKYMNVRITATI